MAGVLRVVQSNLWTAGGELANVALQDRRMPRIRTHESDVIPLSGRRSASVSQRMSSDALSRETSSS